MSTVETHVVGERTFCRACGHSMTAVLGFDVSGGGSERWWFWWVCDHEPDHITCALPAPPWSQKWLRNTLDRIVH